MLIEIVKTAPLSSELDQKVTWRSLIMYVHITFWIVCWFATRATFAALPVMLLWNWVMPDLINTKAIDFWHALGLSLLCTALFKSNVLKDQKESFILALTSFIEEQNKVTVEKLAHQLDHSESMVPRNGKRL